jgi:Fungalysin/Thermolysin Propeptide Motif
MKSRLTPIVLLTALASNSACSDRIRPGAESGSIDTPLPAAGSATQRASFQRLTDSSGPFRIALHPASSVPTHLSGRVRNRLRGGSGAQAAIAFLSDYRQLFRMDAPEAELHALRERKDDLGMTHVRFAQRHLGIAVYGAEVSAHFDREGSLRVIDTTYVADLSGVDVIPSIQLSDAAALAQGDFATRVSSSETPLAGLAELIIYAPDRREPRLAYHLELTSAEGAEVAIRTDYTVDAKTGAILNAFDNLQTAAATGTGSLGKTFTFEATIRSPYPERYRPRRRLPALGIAAPRSREPRSRRTCMQARSTIFTRPASGVKVSTVQTARWLPRSTMAETT